MTVVDRSGSLSVVRMQRGKVNALNPGEIETLRGLFAEVAADPEIAAVVFTGFGKFFSFGFDVPEVVGYSEEAMGAFATSFTRLYRDLFLFPKPLIGAVNGHAVAGGCMLALACDVRVMATGKARISLNEITFGSTVFAGSVEMLRFWTGSRNATKVLATGAMLSAEEACDLGLVDEVVQEDRVVTRSLEVAAELAKSQAAYASIKRLLRQDVVRTIDEREAESIREFIAIWYSPECRAGLRKIAIRT